MIFNLNYSFIKNSKKSKFLFAVNTQFRFSNNLLYQFIKRYILYCFILKLFLYHIMMIYHFLKTMITYRTSILHVN